MKLQNISSLKTWEASPTLTNKDISLNGEIIFITAAKRNKSKWYTALFKTICSKAHNKKN